MSLYEGRRPVRPRLKLGVLAGTLVPPGPPGHAGRRSGRDRSRQSRSSRTSVPGASVLDMTPRCSTTPPPRSTDSSPTRTTRSTGSSRCRTPTRRTAPARGTRFIGGVGALAMGATTYEWMLEHHRPSSRTGPDQWHDFYGDRPGVGLHPPRAAARSRASTSGSRRARCGRRTTRWSPRPPGTNIWVVGGGDLVGQFDDAGLLDEIHVHITPVVLGAGAPLLPRRITSSRLRSGRAAWSVSASTSCST